LDTDGNVFGGFTPVEWESHVWNKKWEDIVKSNEWKSYSGSKRCKGDDSLQSFLFTLKNPHGVSPRKFALRMEKKQYAINCDSACCPVFGDWNIYISSNCSANTNSCTCIGTRWSDSTYVNDTAFRYFFTGEEKFTVKEIEVFEITD
jgi:hypothetical protein